MLYLTHSLNVLLMIVMPLLVARLINDKRRPGWVLFGMGAVTFIASQVVHIPFNWVILQHFRLLPTDTSRTSNLILLALFVGLSAGIFEEGARYLTYRLWAKDARSWGRGLMLGAGHGGVESILVGVVVGVNYLVMARMRQGVLLELVPDGQLPLIQAQIEAVFSAPWHLILLGAVERFLALCFHLSASLLVMQVFIRGQLRWFFLSVLWHTLLNAVSVFAMATWNAYVTEALIGFMALASLIVVFLLRTPEPVEPVLAPLPEPGPRPPLTVELTKEKIEESRYL